jgi:hypothetical protein
LIVKKNNEKMAVAFLMAMARIETMHENANDFFIFKICPTEQKSKHNFFKNLEYFTSTRQNLTHSIKTS